MNIYASTYLKIAFELIFEEVHFWIGTCVSFLVATYTIRHPRILNTWKLALCLQSPRVPLSLRSITHGTVSDYNSITEKRSRHCCGGVQFEEPESQKTSMSMRYLSQTPKEVKESWHISDKRIRGGKKVASSSKILRQEHGIIVDK